MILRYLLLAFGLLCAPLLLHAQGLQHKPRKSPLGMETYRKGDAYLKITYGRPSMRDDMDRKFGLSVPFGKIWRLGDDDATEMTITKPILFAGDTLRAGTYSLFAIPDTTAWTFIVNRQLGQWGTSKYDPSHNILEKRIKVLRSPYVFTNFSIFLQPEKVGVNMYVIWDRTSLVIPIRFLQEEVGDYQSAFDGLLEKDQQRADSLRQVARAKVLSDSLATADSIAATLQADSLQIVPQDTLSEKELPIRKPERMPDISPRIEEQPFDDRPMPGTESIPTGKENPAPSPDATTEQLADPKSEINERKARKQGEKDLIQGQKEQKQELKKQLEKTRKHAEKDLIKAKKEQEKARKHAEKELEKATKQGKNTDTTP